MTPVDLLFWAWAGLSVVCVICVAGLLVALCVRLVRGRR